MRKITENAVNAFYSNGYFKQDNTMVLNGVMQLHRTNIAILKDGKLFLNTDGYTTNTTKERLNGVLEVHRMYIKQKDFQWYLVNKNTNEMFDFVDGMEVTL